MKTKNLWITILVLGLLNSCMSPRKVVYVKDMVPSVNYPSLAVPILKLQKNDRLKIEISSRNPELAAPFNGRGSSYASVDKESISNSSGSNGNSSNYLIDQHGNIAFPILGTLHVAGLGIEEIPDFLAKHLSESGYLNDAIVKVELLNLKINVMGEVNRVGIINVPDARINIMEAISKAGGLTRNAASDRLTVIREEDGVRKKMLVNIETQNIFDSPAYHLQQNDIIYVEPMAAENTPGEDRMWRLTSIVTGIVAIILTALTLLK